MRIICTIVAISLFAMLAISQTVQQDLGKLPPELQVSDPGTRELWTEAYASATNGDYAAAEAKLSRAITICTEKGFLADCAVLKSYMAQWMFLSGKLESADELYRIAYDDALRSGNQVLQADLLISQSIRYRIGEDIEQAKVQLTRALQIAQRSKSRLVIARAYAEQASILLWAGQTKAAEEAITQALAIDEANTYDASLHYIYQAQILRATGKRIAEADEALQRARMSAHERGNAYVFAFATVELAKVVAETGDTRKALRLLAECESGKWEGPRGTIEEMAGLQRTAELPFVTIVLLVTRADIYRQANQLPEAFDTYLKADRIAATANFKTLHAVSTLELARLAAQLNRLEDSEQFARIAADELQKLGLSKQKRNARLLLSDALMGLKKYSDAVEQLSQLRVHAERDNDLLLLFIAQSEIGRAYFVLKDYSKASQHWDDADILVRYLLGNPKVDKKALGVTLLQHYRGMLAAHFQQERPFLALVTWAKAVAAMEQVHDEPNFTTLLKELGQALEATRARNAAEEAYSDRKWYLALTLNQVIEFYDSHQGIAFGERKKLGGRPLDRILDIPFRMTDDEEGARSLEANLAETGPLSPISQRVGYDALIRFYMRRSAPQKAYQYAKELLSFLKLDGETVFETDVENICRIAFVAFQSGEEEAAKEYADKCRVAAKRLPEANRRLIEMSQRVQGHVFSYNDPHKAQVALSEFLSEAPDNDAAQLQLADAYRNQGRIREAFGIWEKLLDKFRGLQDAESQANLSLTVGRALLLYHSTGDFVRNPLPYLTAAKEAYEQLRNERGLFETALATTDYWIKTQKKSEALQTVNAAKELAQVLRDPVVRARAIAKSAYVHSRFKDYQSAVAERETAFRLYQNVGDITGHISLLIDHGSDLNAVGRSAQAVESLQSAIKLADRTTSAFHRRWARQSLGSLYGDRGEYIIAARFHREALEIAETAADATGAGWCSLNLGWAYFNLGEWAEAAKSGESALKYARAQSDDTLEFYTISLLMNVFGDRRSSSLDLSRALELYRDAEAVAKRRPDLDVGILAEVAAEVYWRAGDCDLAIQKSQIAVDRHKKTRDFYSLAHSLMSLTESLIKKGDLGSAERRLSQAEKAIRGLRDDNYTVGRWHYTKAQLLRAQGKHAESAHMYERVLIYLERLKSRIRDSDSLRKAADTYSFVYDELVDAYFTVSQTGQHRDLAARKALEYAEAEKARQFLTAWGPLFARQLRSELPLVIREREQALSYAAEEASALATQAEQGGQPEEIESKRAKEKVARDELDKFAESLRQSHQSYASVKYPKAAQFEQIRREPGEVIVLFRVGADRSYVWIVSGGSVSFERVDRPKQWFRETIERLRDSLNQAQPSNLDQTRLASVFHVLFSSDESRLALLNSKSITVIPDDVLSLLPIEMFTLPSRPGEFPLLSKPVRYFPSVATYIVSQNLPKSGNWTTELLAFGNPVFDKSQPSSNPNNGNAQELLARGLSLDPLPATQKELEEIRTLFPAGAALAFEGKEATKQRVMQTDLSRFRFLHFATHGLLPTDSNLVEPALAFSIRSPNDNDIFLQMSEVLQLQLNAELVVLSACNTGSGKIDHVEGIQNLGRSFMLAGAKSAVVSLWQVADDSTALLMREFYRGILTGKSKRDALAEARLAVFSSGYTHPFYWSPFVLIGD